MAQKILYFLLNLKHFIDNYMNLNIIKEQSILPTLLLKRLGIALACFSMCRFLFYFFNHNLFPDLPSAAFFYGIRFDLAAVALCYLPVIILGILPIPAQKNRLYQTVSKTIFHLINSLALLLNCIDIGYYEFTSKRMTADFFSFASLGDDFVVLLPEYIADFWYLALIWLCMIAFSVCLYRRTQQAIPKTVQFRFLPQMIIIPIVFGLTVVAGRGGLQLKPINIITAGQHVETRYAAVVLNTPFTIAKTSYRQELKPVNYFDAAELTRYFNPIVIQQNRQPIDSLNIVIIIMESFSKEYIGALNNGVGYTPFLDSLIQHSLVFENAFANGKTSITALPSILASLPGLMTEPYITSPYSANQLQSLPHILEKRGYTTSFFHGGKNGTMGFDSFCRVAGIDHYYGKNEYDNDADYDGNWGIYDEQFFQYFVRRLDSMQSPFLTVFQSLSSHQPYSIPDRYRGRFPKGNLPIHESIGYADFALSRFFASASKTDWFSNTLFVITADHTSLAESSYYGNRVGMYAVPIIFYHPDRDLVGIRHDIAQHVDIMPSILDYINYSGQHLTFGRSLFDSTTSGWAVSFINGIYQLIENNMALQFDGENSIALYNLANDSLLKNNLLNNNNPVATILENKLKAIIQTYNQRLMIFTRIVFKLHHVQLMIEPPLGEQFLMMSRLDDPSLFNSQNSRGRQTPSSAPILSAPKKADRNICAPQ
jgi:phosphoglycerol transferase MdoB-like AlkP superfamily enzyme